MTKLNRRIWLFARRLVYGDVFRCHGVSITVPTTVDAEIRYILARNRPYEEPELRFAQSLLHAGTHVVELGGSIGVLAAVIRGRIGPDATQIIVEANPMLAKVCKANASQNANPGRVQVIEAAIDYSGAATVFFDFGHNAHTGQVAKSGVPVTTVTLTDVMRNLPEGAAALICDIEGAELALFASEGAQLSRFDTIILETHPNLYPEKNASLDEMVKQILSRGFTQADVREDVFAFIRPAP